MKNHKLGLRRWSLGGQEAVKYQGLTKVVFKADQPILRPVGDAVDCVVKVFLLDFVLGHQDIALASQ